MLKLKSGLLANPTVKCLLCWAEIGPGSVAGVGEVGHPAQVNDPGYNKCLSSRAKTHSPYATTIPAYPTTSPRSPLTSPEVAYFTSSGFREGRSSRLFNIAMAGP